MAGRPCGAEGTLGYRGPMHAVPVDETPRSDARLKARAVAPSLSAAGTAAVEAALATAIVNHRPERDAALL